MPDIEILHDLHWPDGNDAGCLIYPLLCHNEAGKAMEEGVKKIYDKILNENKSIRETFQDISNDSDQLIPFLVDAITNKRVLFLRSPDTGDVLEYVPQFRKNNVNPAADLVFGVDEPLDDEVAV
jgi:hypothetical protein